MGQNFEMIIDIALKHYEKRKTAFVQKTPEPMKPIKDLGNGKFIAHYEKCAQPDYKGILRGGRTIIFEAKHTTSEKIEQSRVTPEQSDYLDTYAELGAVCFVLIGFSMRDFYRIPWSVFREMKSHYGRKYVTRSDIEQYRIRDGSHGQLLFIDEAVGDIPASGEKQGD